ncbi:MULTISPECIES: CobW family GTP-binding protein [Marinomonas]|uniref:GTP-binding protein n=1 Tax=Marinomonas arctica TaxID=383750 RepID=A0A7H1J2P5_9GAMM|nr:MULTISPECIES: CobW family GTP-binding protein [Marinomonas]QNT04761.1 GTP-binding protein [Marinomonas arctica]
MTLITGFLGAGKTTLIRQLLTQAPPHERWAVLVNEFGDIGLDGAFYADLGVAIREVPGGCVCCTTSAAFQLGLNQLIRQHNPDRIFIEPSGLGHPQQIIAKLRSDSYHNVLLFTGAFCVLDARHLNDERYTKHDIFHDQIESADGIVFSHVDRYLQADKQNITSRFGEFSPSAKPLLYLSDPMHLDLDALDIGLADLSHPDSMLVTHNIARSSSAHEHEHEHEHDHQSHDSSSQEVGWHYQKQQDAMQVLGWKWSKDKVFDAIELRSSIQSMVILEGVYRIKGVFVTGLGEALFVNASQGEITLSVFPWSESSRLEIIGDVEGTWPFSCKQTLSIAGQF